MVRNAEINDDRRAILLLLKPRVVQRSVEMADNNLSIRVIVDCLCGWATFLHKELLNSLGGNLIVDSQVPRNCLSAAVIKNARLFRWILPVDVNGEVFFARLANQNMEGIDVGISCSPGGR